MRKPKKTSHTKSNERGQTLVLVALTLVSLLAMAALAIDVVTLYVAKSEAQRAADAAALAGAKAFVDSGVTTDPSNSSLQTLAQAMATAIINAMIGENKVAGTAPQLASAPSFDFSQDGNPRITVTVQRTDLPIFFARIWGGTLANVSASATAEAYNASNSQTITGNLVPIAPRCVKPFLIPNLNPLSTPPGLPYITVGTGVVAPGVVGKGPATWRDPCPPGGGGNTCGPPVNLPAGPGDYYFPAVVSPNTNNLCPACQGSSYFEQSVECCDSSSYACGGTVSNASIDLTIPGNTFRQDTHQGLQCLINGAARDTLDTSNFPLGPMQITANSGPQSGQLVSTSNSIVTLPIFDNLTMNPTTGQVTVIGFLQAFVWDANGAGDIQMTILNVVGCGNNPTGTPISGGGITPIPVRLIHN
jgi:Flp pilus assembly protein TadG